MLRCWKNFWIELVNNRMNANQAVIINNLFYFILLIPFVNSLTQNISIYSLWNEWNRRPGVSKYHNRCCTNALRVIFEHVPDICQFHWWTVFLVESKTSVLGTILLKCQIIWGFAPSNVGLKVSFCIASC
jgi:hypothetical protein